MANRGPIFSRTVLTGASCVMLIVLGCSESATRSQSIISISKNNISKMNSHLTLQDKVDDQEECGVPVPPGVDDDPFRMPENSPYLPCNWPRRTNNSDDAVMSKIKSKYPNGICLKGEIKVENFIMLYSESLIEFTTNKLDGNGNCTDQRIDADNIRFEYVFSNGGDAASHECNGPVSYCADTKKQILSNPVGCASGFATVDGLKLGLTIPSGYICRVNGRPIGGVSIPIIKW